MSKTKKAQGLSLDMIVVGAIGLVVLVVIITIFVSSLQKSQDDITKTQTGSDCPIDSKMMYVADCNRVGGTPQIGNFKGLLHILKSQGDEAEFKDYVKGSQEVSSGPLYVCCKV